MAVIKTNKPLAERLRPMTLSEFVGQAALLAEDQPLRRAVETGTLHSMILWGPPGCGKTTFANLLAHEHAELVKLSAVTAGVKDVRQVIDLAKENLRYGKQTVLFLDEVHRFNKAQQDVLLPHIENGTIVFVGATTENPSFALNNALLSRARTYVFQALDDDALRTLLNRALTECELTATETEAKTLLKMADGDGRQLLNLVETVAQAIQITPELTLMDALTQASKHSVRRFDNKGDHFYDLISALHKSVRGSNPHAAMYWFARMVDGGCDLHYLARRLAVMASEDIGNADPRALDVAMNAWQAYERIGSPEGHINLAQAVSYLACAAKSNASYMAYNEALSDVKNLPSYPVPNHLCNAPTTLMKDIGKGKGYRYAHDEPNAYAAGEHYFPEDMLPRTYYRPSERGVEIKIKEKLALLAALDEEAGK